MNLRLRLTIALAGISAVVAISASVAAQVTASKSLHQQLDESLLRRAMTPIRPNLAPGVTRNELDRLARSLAGAQTSPTSAPSIVAADTARRGSGASSTKLGSPRRNGGPLNGPFAAARTTNGDAEVDCRPTRRGLPDAAVQFVSSDGKIIFCAEASPLPIDEKDLALTRAPGRPRLKNVRLGQEHLRVVTFFVRPGLAGQVARDLSEIDVTLSSLVRRLLVLDLAAILAAGTAGWLIARRLVRPIEHLQEVTESIAKTGKLDSPVKVDGDAEVAGLATSFNAMISALSVSRTQQQRLIADASHELRTPLTSIRTNAEFLQRATALPEDQRLEVLQAVVAEADELSELVRELVELASDQAGSPEQLELARLSEVARIVADRMARRSGREIVVASINDIQAKFRPKMIERAISNLVENAVKYAPGTEAIVINVDAMTVSVKDAGPGLAAEDLPHIFERFYRSVGVRNAPGSGLGLAIVAQIADRHNGSVFAKSPQEGGAEIGFTIGEASETSNYEVSE